jgi:hypothetical protein
LRIRTVTRAAATLPLALALMSLSACGGSGSSGGQPSGGAPTPTPTPVAPAPTPTPSAPVGSGYLSLAPIPASSYPFDVAGLTGWGYNGDPATGRILPNSNLSGESPRVAFRYDHVTRTYTLVTIDVVTGEERFLLFSAPETATSPAHSDARFLGYSGPALWQDSTGVLRLYRAGSANPELALTYSGMGHLARSGPLGHLNFGDYWFGYGVQTRVSDVPASGTASYSGIVHGFGVDPTAGIQYRLEGTSSLVLDFAARKVSGIVTLTLIAEDGTRISVGTADFADGTIGDIQGAPYPFIIPMAGASVANGSVQGRLYGPAAVEVSGIWGGRISVPAGSGEVHAHGAFAAVRN